MNASFNDMFRDWQRHLAVMYDAHKAVLFMLLASFMTTLVAANAKILQENGLTAEEVLLGGMAIKLTIVLLYMIIYKVPDAPYGPRQFRGLLVIRGVGGSVGILGFYYALPYLHVSVATVIIFLAPMLGTFGITILLRTPLTQFQCVAAFVSLAGVIMIAKPWQVSPDSPSLAEPIEIHNPTQPSPSTIEHVVAIGSALVSAIGTATGLIALSKIGTAVNPIISVGYFSVSTTLVSAAIFLAHITRVSLPNEPMIWVRLGLHGLGSFLMQLLGAMGMAAERGTRALNALYSQVVFALIVDKVIWNTTPDWSSIGGGTLVLASVIGVAIVSRPKPPPSLDEVPLSVELEEPVVHEDV